MPIFKHKLALPFRRGGKSKVQAEGINLLFSEDLLATVPLVPYFFDIDSGHVEVVEHLVKVNYEANAIGANSKTRCRMLGVPWVARLVPAYWCSSLAVGTIRWLQPSTFAQVFPTVLESDRSLFFATVARGGPHAEWLARNFAALRKLTNNVSDVVDYLQTVQTPLPAKISPQHVLEKSNDWHERHFYDVIAGLQQEAWYNHSQSDLPPTIEYKWLDLKLRQELVKGSYQLKVLCSQQELRAESRTMQHCVQIYWNRVLSGASIICSLRRVHSEDTPLVTVELDNAGHIVQIKGKRNRGPTQQELALVHEFVSRIKLVLPALPATRLKVTVADADYANFLRAQNTAPSEADLLCRMPTNYSLNYPIQSLFNPNYR